MVDFEHVNADWGSLIKNSCFKFVNGARRATNAGETLTKLVIETKIVFAGVGVT